jgi:hypothetical protein
MAARVSQVVARAEDKHNFILMHAMGPNVAGVIGTARAGGLFLITPDYSGNNICQSRHSGESRGPVLF